MFLLDSNVCIRLINKSSAQLETNFKQRPPSAIYLSAVVKAELLYGAHHSQRAAQNLRLLEQFFAPFPSLPFDDACAEIYGRIRHELAAAGTPIGPNDLLIAATAIANKLTLVTYNTREFRRGIGLQLVDWD